MRIPTMIRNVTAVVLVVLVACSSTKSNGGPASDRVSASASAPSASYSEHPCDASIPTDPRVVCGTLTVPEDRSRPDAGTVELAVVTIHPKPPAAATNPDPVVFLQGGPGLSSTGAIPDLLNRDFGDRDLILFDQRGSGLSKPGLYCGDWTKPTWATIATTDAATRLDIGTRMWTECRDRLTSAGVDLAAFNIAADVADLEDLRVALHIDQWNVWGMSYGTRVALQAARAHASSMRSLTLESVIPPTTGMFGPDFVTNGFRRLFDACAADAACASKHPTLAADLDSVVARLDASPHHGTVTDAAGVAHPSVMNGDDVLAMLWTMLTVPQLDPALVPKTIADLKDGNEAWLDTWRGLVSSSSGTDYAHGMDASFECADDGAPTGNVGALREHPTYSSVLAQDIRIFCDVWDVPRLPQSYRDSVTFSVPTLVFAGQLDPNTPPQSGKVLAAGLPHAVYVELPGLTHTPTFAPAGKSDCPRQIMRAFVDAPEAVPSTACVDTMTIAWQ